MGAADPICDVTVAPPTFKQIEQRAEVYCQPLKNQLQEQIAPQLCPENVRHITQLPLRRPFFFFFTLQKMM